MKLGLSYLPGNNKYDIKKFHMTKYKKHATGTILFIIVKSDKWNRLQTIEATYNQWILVSDKTSGYTFL